MEVKELARELETVRDAVARVVVGYDEVVVDLLVGLLSRGHVLLEGVPGLAKTTLAKTFARATGLSFNRVQFTQDLLPADITGHYFYDRSEETFELRAGPVFSQVLLADEINRAPPKTQSALLEAMEERQVTIEGDTYRLPAPFMVIATMNPVDVDGVYRLPEAQLDRFMLRTEMGYLSDDEERTMLAHKARRGAQKVPEIDPALIEEAQARLSEVHVSQEVIRYIQALGQATREHPTVELGASPRAMEQMLKASQAVALLSGRDHVLPDDVKYIVPSVLAHRLILDVDAEIEGLTARDILDEIVETIEVPKGFENAPVEDPRQGPPADEPGHRTTGTGTRDPPTGPGPHDPGTHDVAAGPSPVTQDPWTSDHQPGRPTPSSREHDPTRHDQAGRRDPSLDEVPVRDGRQLLDPPERRPRGRDTDTAQGPATETGAQAIDPRSAPDDPAVDRRPSTPAADPDPGPRQDPPGLKGLGATEDPDLDALPKDAEVTETTHREIVEEDGRRITITERTRIVDHADRRTERSTRQKTVEPLDADHATKTAPTRDPETTGTGTAPRSQPPSASKPTPTRDHTPPARPSHEGPGPDQDPATAHEPEPAPTQAAGATRSNGSTQHNGSTRTDRSTRANGHHETRDATDRPGRSTREGPEKNGVRFPVVARRPADQASDGHDEPAGSPPPETGSPRPRPTSQAGNYEWPPAGWRRDEDGNLMREPEADTPRGPEDPAADAEPAAERDGPGDQGPGAVDGDGPGLSRRLVSATTDLLDKLTDQTQTER